MDKLTGEIFFQLHHLTGRVKHEIITGDIEEEIYKGKIYKVHFPLRKNSVSIHGRIYVKEGGKIFTASAKLEPRGGTDILTLIEELKIAKQPPIINIFKMVKVTVTPFSALPQFEVELKIEKHDLATYTASLTSDRNLLFVGDYVGWGDAQYEVVDVYGRKLKLKEVGRYG